MGTNFDEDLKNMFQHLNFGNTANMNDMMKTLIRNVQLGTLKQLRKAIDDSIKGLSSEEPPGLDPYEILGVNPSDTREEIDRAYKKKAKEHHPDSGGLNMEMVKINAAYEAIRQVRGWRK